jgi:hypothetical protein
MRLLILLIALTISPAFAADDAPPPPPLPEIDDTALPTVEDQINRDDFEPQIKIIERGDKKIEEYRVAGQLYMVKITPAGGVPYYLVDQDGDGDMETRMHDFNSNQNLPRWVLFRW